MKIRALLALLAILLLAGCGASTAATASHASHAPATRAAAAPSCRQQYEAWKQQATPEADKMKAALDRVQSASDAEDIPAMTSGLHAAGRDAAVLRARYPLPPCADPHGYYPKFLARITAAGDNAKDGSGLSALVLAEAPLQTVPKIETKLSAELDQTTGKNR
jgi:hypothetical protein